MKENMNLSDYNKLTPAKQQQIDALLRILVKNPDQNIQQAISEAIKFHNGELKEFISYKGTYISKPIDRKYINYTKTLVNYAKKE